MAKIKGSQVILGAVGCLTALISIPIANSFKPEASPLVQPPASDLSEFQPQAGRRFSCVQTTDQKETSYVVSYHEPGQLKKPWLKMVRAMGGGWNQASRCNEIARRLDIYRQEELLGFQYRTDPDTPGQYVICAKTKITKPGDCPLVLTLFPEQDPQLAIQEVAFSLLKDNPISYERSAIDPNQEEIVYISLEELL
jgi:hypothetical protein